MIRIYEVYIPLVHKMKKAFDEKIIKYIQTYRDGYYPYIDLSDNIQLTRYSTGEVELKSDKGSFTIYPEDFDRIEII